MVDIVTGVLLGVGSFNTVTEVKSINTSDHTVTTAHDEESGLVSNPPCKAQYAINRSEKIYHTPI